MDSWKVHFMHSVIANSQYAVDIFLCWSSHVAQLGAVFNMLLDKSDAVAPVGGVCKPWKSDKLRAYRCDYIRTRLLSAW